MENKIGAIIIAGGKSSRMGSDIFAPLLLKMADAGGFSQLIRDDFTACISTKAFSPVEC